MNELIKKINNFYTVVESWLSSIWDMFFEPEQKNVNVKKLDENGNVEDIQFPNYSKLKNKVLRWMEEVEKTIGYVLTCTGYIKTSYTLADMNFDTSKVIIGSGDWAGIQTTDKPGALSFTKEGDPLTVEHGKTATLRIKLLAMFCRESDYGSGMYDISFGGTAMVECDASGNITVTQSDIKAGIILIRSETDAETGAHKLYPYLWNGFLNGNPDIDAYMPRLSMGTAQIISRT